MSEEISDEQKASEDAKTTAVTIQTKQFGGEFPLSVNGQARTLRYGGTFDLHDWELEALDNAGIGYTKIESSDDDSTAGAAEGSAASVDQGPDDNRTEPHQNPDIDPQSAIEVETAIPGAIDEESGAPIIKGGDEPDPLVHGDDVVVREPAPLDQPEEPALPDADKKDDEQKGE